jgi:hypothetical protein
MKLNELQAKYVEVIGKETRSHNKTFLIRKITEALQATDGDASETTASHSEGTETAVAADATATTAPAAEKLTKLDTAQLQARYLEEVGRSTGSSNKAYLIWKIREARKGRIPVGPRKSARREDVTFKILPLRLEAALVDKLDEAWKRQRLHSRADLLRKSLHIFLRGCGENEVAALLTDAAWRMQ